MKKLISTNKKGFTIIEIVLVLAIAGLIFLMVFIALPALQRAQRDTQIRQDVGNIKAALESYKSNNKGKLPLQNKIASDTTHSYIAHVNASGPDCRPNIGNARHPEVEDDFRRYLGGVSDDTCVYFIASNRGNGTGNISFGTVESTFRDYSGNDKNMIFVFIGGAKCGKYSTSDSVWVNEVPRNLNAYVVMAKLSNNTVYCLDNQ